MFVFRQIEYLGLLQGEIKKKKKILTSSVNIRVTIKSKYVNNFELT